VHIYLTRQEYEDLRRVSEATGLSVKELVLKAIRDVNSLSEDMAKVGIQELFRCVILDECDDRLFEEFSKAAERYNLECLDIVWRAEGAERRVWGFTWKGSSCIPLGWI